MSENTVEVVQQNYTTSVTQQNYVVEVNNLAIPSGASSVSASNVTSTATGSVTATNVQAAIQQLARKQYSQDSAPTDVEAGTFWYETDTENLYVYREVAPGTFEWQVVIINDESGDSDILDAGSY
jgi:hypothetical protein